MIVVTGIIIRRRSFGKRLAFADIEVLSSSTKKGDSNGCVEENNDSCYNFHNIDNDDGSTGALVTDHENNSQDPEKKERRRRIIHVAFRRTSPSWDITREDTFPTKASSLPYGAKVALNLVHMNDHNLNTQTAVKKKEEPNSEKIDMAGDVVNDGNDKKLIKERACLEVASWEIITHPHTIATNYAMIDTKNIISSTIGNENEDSNSSNNDDQNQSYDDGDSGDDNGILYSAYFKSRGDHFFKYHSNQPPKQNKKLQQEVQLRQQVAENNDNCQDVNSVNQSTIDQSLVLSSPDYDEDRFNHPNSTTSESMRSKSFRAKIFASWILNKFGPSFEMLKRGNGVLDIAGGKGQLSIELSILAKIPCTIVDPLVRGGRRKDGSASSCCFSKRDMKRLKKTESPIPTYKAKRFVFKNNYIGGVENWSNSMAQRSSCLIGLHPDQCTEDILDAALKHEKSVAIVPCCVFPTFFPMRRLRGSDGSGNRPVKTYDDFLCYLLEKDDRLRRETLMFEGKNQVIYLDQQQQQQN